MLEEFILGQLETLSLRRDELTKAMNALASQEEEDHSEIARLLETEDLGLELFSPRTANNSVREQINTIKKHLEELEIKQTEIRGELEQLTLNENKYQEMLLEARTRKADIKEEKQENRDSSDADETTDNTTEKGILSYSDTAEMNKDTDDQVPIEVSNEDKDKFKEEYIETLETILKRVDHCIDLSHRDKIKCRNELKNLRYYMKAVISKNQKE